jgi:3-hydroxybenzoate 6-monooxygenase
MGAPEFGAIAFGYGIQFGPNAFHVFDRLELMEPVLAVADSSSAVLMRDALDGKELVRMTGPSLRARFKPGARSWFTSMSFHGTF